MGWRLLVAAGVLALLVVANAVGDAGRRVDQGPAGLGTRCGTGSSSSWSARWTAGPARWARAWGAGRPSTSSAWWRSRCGTPAGRGRTFAGGQQYLFDRAGKRHDPDLDATLCHGAGQLLSAHLNPGQRLAGTLVYDVPDPVELARVELHDAPFSDGASVTLD